MSFLRNHCLIQVMKIYTPLYLSKSSVVLDLTFDLWFILSTFLQTVWGRSPISFLFMWIFNVLMSFVEKIIPFPHWIVLVLSLEPIDHKYLGGGLLSSGSIYSLGALHQLPDSHCDPASVLSGCAWTTFFCRSQILATSTSVQPRSQKQTLSLFTLFSLTFSFDIDV